MLILILLVIIVGQIDKINMICDTEPEYFVYNCNKPGPHILIIGATHGNEPTGYYVIKEFTDSFNCGKIRLKRGKIILYLLSIIVVLN